VAFGHTADLDPVTFDELFTANVRSAYYLVASIAPRMAKRGTGSIVNVGSIFPKLGIGSRFQLPQALGLTTAHTAEKGLDLSVSWVTHALDVTGV
jgi:NAD(P)-dependent dehydrogenase (short-subunit alcohol dehydrogenase family)